MYKKTSGRRPIVPLLFAALATLLLLFAFLSRSASAPAEGYVLAPHRQFLLSAALVLYGFALLYALFPRLLEKRRRHRLAWLHFLLTAGSLALLLLPVHHQGIAGRPLRYYDYEPQNGFLRFLELNPLTSAAVIAGTAAQLLALANLIVVLFSAKRKPLK